MIFTKSWIGYDLPADALEAHPAVQTLRSQGIEKKGPREYHLLMAYFESVELEALNALVAETEAEQGVSLAEATLGFDGYGLIESATGKYVYFSPSSGGAKAAGDLKAKLVALSSYDKAKNCRDLHVTIGGEDPLAVEKPKRGPLKQPFEVNGRLTFVGFGERGVRRFFWNTGEKVFVEDRPVAAAKPVESEKRFVPPAVEEMPSAPPVVPMETAPKPAENLPPPVAAAVIPVPEAPKALLETPVAAPPSVPKPVTPAAAGPSEPPAPTEIKTLHLPTKVMPDVACAVFLLRVHGAKLFPGAAEAQIVFSNELPAGKTPDALLKEGALVIERKGESAAGFFAARLGVADRAELRKLLAFAKRDFERKGIASNDPVDRAFGLAGISMMMNRVYTDDPRAVLDFLTSIFEAHAFDESRRPS